MDDAEVEALIEQMGRGVVEVEIDVHPYHSGSSIAAVAMHDEQRRASLARGERVAYVYSPEWIAQHAGWRLWSRASLVTREQAKRLLTNGAKWVGPEHHNPAT